MEFEVDFESDLTDTDSFDKKVTSSLKLDSLKRHRCPFEGCHSAFNRPWKLERHVNTHIKSRSYKCNVDGCKKDYTNKVHLQRHISISHTSHSTVYLDCPFPNCKKAFNNKWNLKKHCNIHKEIKFYKCELCSASFKKHQLLKNHLSSHLGIKPYACQSCTDAFESKKDLKMHEKKHKTYLCDRTDCNEKFDKFHALRTHLKKAHPNWLECDFCKKKYLNKFTLTEHVLSHLPTDSRETLICPYEACNRSYFHQRNLDHHIRSYHQDINHKCTICQQTFVNRTKLKEHLKLHTTPKIIRKKSCEPRNQRKDKGLPKKSMAAKLSGIQLSKSVDKNLAQNKITEHDLSHIQKVREILLEQNEINEVNSPTIKEDSYETLENQQSDL